MTNPPYGERISTPDLLGTYKMIGERLKHQFVDNDAWILSYREECFEQIGLRPSIKIPLYNGSLECEFRKYQTFEGRMKEFRTEGGAVQSDEERKQMAEKGRFKKNREFKKRFDEAEENEEGDIRSFKFHRIDFDRFDKRDRRDDRRDRDGWNRDRRDDRRGSDWGGRNRDRDSWGRDDRFRQGRNDRKQNKGGRDYDRKRNRYDNDR